MSPFHLQICISNQYYDARRQTTRVNEYKNGSISLNADFPTLCVCCRDVIQYTLCCSVQQPVSTRLGIFNRFNLLFITHWLISDSRIIGNYSNVAASGELSCVDRCLERTSSDTSRVLQLSLYTSISQVSTRKCRSSGTGKLLPEDRSCSF